MTWPVVVSSAAMLFAAGMLSIIRAGREATRAVEESAQERQYLEDLHAYLQERTQDPGREEASWRREQRRRRLGSADLYGPPEPRASLPPPIPWRQQ